jgi:hypothetical protein
LSNSTEQRRVILVRRQKSLERVLDGRSPLSLSRPHVDTLYGLHLMKAQRLRACWSTDFHLGLTGVPLVINES